MGLSTAKIKEIRSLATKKGRDASDLFIVEGEKMVSEALESPFETVEVYRRDEIGEEAMSRISQLSTPSPALAVLRRRPVSAPPSGPGLYLALDSIRDPGNLGTILRIADWFGIRSVIASPDTVDLYNPKVVQSTMGAIFRVDVHYADLISYAASIRRAGGCVYGTFLDGENLFTAPLNCGADSPAVIVIGNESNGISPDVAAVTDTRLTIPSFPAGERTSESLNAAAATAITVAEFRRRCYL